MRRLTRPRIALRSTRSELSVREGMDHTLASLYKVPRVHSEDWLESGEPGADGEDPECGAARACARSRAAAAPAPPIDECGFGVLGPPAPPPRPP
ncbi:unnamed protein product, partial [Prorocentrum cordatum]